MMTGTGPHGMARVVVVYHSGYGHTQRMANSIAEGAGAEIGRASCRERVLWYV